MNRNKILIISSILMLICVFSFNYLIMGLGMTQYAIVVFYNLYRMFKDSNTTPAKIVEHAENQSNLSLKEKKFVRWAVYGIAIPITIVGAIVIVMMLCTVLYIGFTGGI